MFHSALRLISMIVLPHPNFSVPPSVTEPIYRVKNRTTEHDTSYIAQTLSLRSESRRYSIPLRIGTNAHARFVQQDRRHTICCCSCHCPVAPSTDIPTSVGHPNFYDQEGRWYNSLRDSPLRYGPTHGTPYYASLTVTSSPTSSPTPGHSYPKEVPSEDPVIDPCKTSNDPISVNLNPKSNPINVSSSYAVRADRRNKETSFPFTIDKGVDNNNFIFVTPESPATTASGLISNKAPRPRTQSHSQSYSKVFGLELSPILEDNNNSSKASVKFGVAKTASSHDLSTSDSSYSSYGEVLERKSTTQHSMNVYDHFWESKYRTHQGNNHSELADESSNLPILTLTFPTPEPPNPIINSLRPHDIDTPETANLTLYPRRTLSVRGLGIGDIGDTCGDVSLHLRLNEVRARKYEPPIADPQRRWSLTYEKQIGNAWRRLWHTIKSVPRDVRTSTSDICSDIEHVDPVVQQSRKNSRGSPLRFFKRWSTSSKQNGRSYTDNRDTEKVEPRNRWFGLLP